MPTKVLVFLAKCCLLATQQKRKREKEKKRKKKKEVGILQIIFEKIGPQSPYFRGEKSGNLPYLDHS
jgi:hypothetical protein